MSCRILLIRHGQSTGNLDGKFIGQYNVELTPLGYKQAELTAGYLKNEHIDIVYSSDLSRAYHTAVPTAKQHKLPIKKNKTLREINAGEWENKPFTYLLEKYKDGYAGVWKHDIGRAEPPGGETVARMYRRISSALTRIAKRNDGKTVAVFSHATPIRAFYVYALGKPVTDMQPVPYAPNASVSEFIFENGKFKTVRYGYDEFIGDLSTSLPTTC